MHGRTRGIVIALASSAVGGLLPAAVSTQMLGVHVMAAGLGVVALMNAVIAIIHIAAPVGPDRVRNDDYKVDAAANQVAMAPAHVELKIANQDGGVSAARTKPSKEPLTFPVIGWYGPNPVGAEHLLDQIPEVVLKKSAKHRAQT